MGVQLGSAEIKNSFESFFPYFELLRLQFSSLVTVCVYVNLMHKKSNERNLKKTHVRLFCQQMPDHLAGEDEDNDSARKRFFFKILIVTK